MSTDYTTTGLLSSLKRRGQIPTTAGSMTTADFLAIANEELQSYMMTLMDEVNEEYYVTYTDYSIVSGTDTYAIPSRSVDATLRQVLISDGNGNFYPLPRIEPEIQHRFSYTGMPSGYKLEANNVVLIPSPTSSTGTLRLRYVARPNSLVQTNAVAVITGILPNVNQVITASASTPGTIVAGTVCDFVKPTPHFDWRGMDYTASSLAIGGGNNTYTFASLPTGLTVGDYLCVAGESPVAQLPWSLHPLLASRVVATYLQSIGSKDAQAAEAVCKRKHDEALKRMKPRVMSGGRALVNRHGPGWRGVS